MRRITLIASGGVRLTALLPDSTPTDVRVVRACDPRDQPDGDGYRHRHVYFERRLDDVYVQVEVVVVPCADVEIQR